MNYRREQRLIYSKDEICELYGTDDLEFITSRSPYISNISGELFVYKSGRGHIDLIEQLAVRLREDHPVYISFEDALSKWGVISQVPMRLIVATTGKSGEYVTDFGFIEFCHVEHTDEQIRENTLDTSSPLRIAKKIWAYQDLKIADRNMHMIDFDELLSIDEMD